MSAGWHLLRCPGRSWLQCPPQTSLLSHIGSEQKTKTCVVAAAAAGGGGGTGSEGKTMKERKYLVAAAVVGASVVAGWQMLCYAETNWRRCPMTSERVMAC